MNAARDAQSVSGVMGEPGGLVTVGRVLSGAAAGYQQAISAKAAAQRTGAAQHSGHPNLPNAWSAAKAANISL